MKLSIVGDWTYQNYRPLDETIIKIFNSCDNILYNFESTIDFGGSKIQKVSNFSVSINSDLLLNSKTVCHLANNHICDLGVKNAFMAIKYIKEKSKIIGIRSHREKIDPFTILSNNSEKIGIIGCSEWNFRNSYFSFLEINSREFWTLISELRQQVDVLIVSVHWGMEQVFNPGPKQVMIARKCLKKGVDLLVGHHSHVFQPHIKDGSKYIFFSIGNFQFSPYRYKEIQSYSNILLYDSRKQTVNLLPIKIEDSNPLLINDKHVERFYNNFNENFISWKNYILYSLSRQYEQNWGSWKIRFKKFGKMEYLRYIRFIIVKENFIGLVMFIVFVKIFRLEYNPIDELINNKYKNHES